ncbi:TRF-like 2 [Artemisia annua]|uniref:TRF-like 2 n=1 Tax=Artemisia annua TaxID=35608 RepID=A0A2U1KNV4_ARTAN|nr:TRF-like 2 [Artemisia annua]
MMLQKRLEYGFNGYQVPPTPRAARSATRRVPFWKKTDDNNNNKNNKPICAFDLLATVAGELLQEGGDKSSGEEPETKTEHETVENDPSNVNNICDQGSSNRNFFVSEIISQAPVIQDSYTSVVRDNDDDENSFGVTRTPNKNFKSPPRIGDRRIKRFLASKYWKPAPKLNDEVHCDADIQHDSKPCFKRQRSLKDYPFKKRRLYEQLDDFSNSDVIDDEDRPNTPQKAIESGSHLSLKSEGGKKTSGFISKQNPAFQQRDSHVKLKIKSFRVPELFFELPKTSTVGTLKRNVMDALTSMLSGELHVGVMLQGKKIRDDDKTLLQTGIHNKVDSLGFTLEPKEPHIDQSFPPTPVPKPSIRYSPAPNVSNKLVVRREVSDAFPDPPMTNPGGSVESEHDSAPSPPHLSLGNKSGSDSRALVTVPRALSVVPLRKCKRSEVAQRRIRRPFSVSEVEALVQAVEKLGTGRWRDVKLRAFDNAKHRTYVDLKDKWKTLVHTARISPQQRRGEPVPQELLDRVLAAHAYWSHHQAKQQFKHPSQPETCRLL